jgi:hypothetical protein
LETDVIPSVWRARKVSLFLPAFRGLSLEIGLRVTAMITATISLWIHRGNNNKQNACPHLSHFIMLHPPTHLRKPGHVNIEQLRGPVHPEVVELKLPKEHFLTLLGNFHHE